MFLLREIKTLATDQACTSRFLMETSDLISYAQHSEEIFVYSSYLCEEGKDSVQWLHRLRKTHENIIGMQDYSFMD